MVLQVKSTPKPMFFQIAENFPQYAVGFEQSKPKRRLPPPLESAFTVVLLASENILLLGELSRDSSERFSRRKFFQFKMENIFLESVIKMGIGFISTAIFSRIRMATEYPCDGGTALAKIGFRKPTG
jgi:hypothetical protein